VASWHVPVKLAATSLALGVLAGCGEQSLTDTWPIPPAPQLQTPVVGACHHVSASPVARSLYYQLMRTVASCAEVHKSETIHVGQFTGDHAERLTPPPASGPGARLAYRECAEAAQETLGGDWHAAWTNLRVFVPSAAAWTGGARWFRCDLVQIDNDVNVVKDRSGSLRDGLRGQRPLAITCARYGVFNDGSVSGVSTAPCTSRHTAEFTGVLTVTPSGLARPDDDALGDAFDGCWELTARYLSVRLDRVPRALRGFYWHDDDAWARGDQSFRCFVAVLDIDKPIQPGATLAGLGTKPVPTV